MPIKIPMSAMLTSDSIRVKPAVLQQVNEGLVTANMGGACHAKTSDKWH